MRKCVFASLEVAGEEEEVEKVLVSASAGGETSLKAATVREAAVPLWAEHRCAVERNLRNPLIVRAGRATLSVGVVAEGWWLVTQCHIVKIVPTQI